MPSGVVTGGVPKMQRLTNDSVYLSYRAASFHLPEETTVPIIMVGPGTGIAPFRSFWQHRYYQKSYMTSPVPTEGDEDENGLGRMQLYFGCRNTSLDFLYKDELINMKEGGILDDVYVALSREPDQPKVNN